MKSFKNLFVLVVFGFLVVCFIQIGRLDLFIKAYENKKMDFNKAQNVNAFSRNPEENSAQYLIFFDGDEDYSVKVKNNLEKSLDFIKKGYKVYDIDSKNSDINYVGKNIIVTASDLSECVELENWVNSVNNGSSLFFAQSLLQNGAFFSIYRKLGIYDTGDMHESKGIKFLDDFLVGAKGIFLKGSFISNTCNRVYLEKNCKVHAVTNDDIPLIWDVKCGKGKIVVMNGAILTDKFSRGILTACIGLMKDTFIYPVLNAKVVNIDDFPAPFPNGYNKNLYEIYGKSTRQFFKDIWWTDMMKIASKNGLKYTIYVIEDYNNKVEPPFTNSEESASNLLVFGRDVLKNGGEIGIHGYNHQSLVMDKAVIEEYGYVPWTKEEFMIKSLEEVQRFIHSAFPKYKIRAYVPPSNAIGAEGISAILKTSPDLRIISSIYYAGNSELPYEQEFGIDKNGIINFPRITYGYEYNEENIWAAVNGINSLGVFSHFIHPDDVIDKERSGGKTWKVLGKEFSKLIELATENYTWLRDLTTSEAGYELKYFMSTVVNLKQSPHLIEGSVETQLDNVYFILKCDKKIIATKNCITEKIGSNVYLVKTPGGNFSVKLEGE